jgi:hypothetical protein
MPTEKTSKAEAWPIFDEIVSRALVKRSADDEDGEHTNPWVRDIDGTPRFEPDYETLCLLLGVPLWLKANTQSGVPALALDVWLSYELRRAGFTSDQTWPRPSHPRILPAAVAQLLEVLPGKEARSLRARIERPGAVLSGVTSSSATILGKNYLKQVDVIITDWATGPELLISTKRMDSSYGKNAPNRVEESYGDAKNLRLRHPLAALGFVFGLRSDILEKEPATAEWLFDLLIKLGREDDAYHATGLVLMEYSSAELVENGEEPTLDVTLEPGAEPEEEVAPRLRPDIGQTIERLPKVKILLDQTPDELKPNRFLAAMVNRVLGTTPVTMHKDARKRRAEAANAPPAASP